MTGQTVGLIFKAYRTYYYEMCDVYLCYEYILLIIDELARIFYIQYVLIGLIPLSPVSYPSIIFHSVSL